MKKQEKIDALKRLKKIVQSNKFGKGIKQHWGLCHILWKEKFDYNEIHYIKALLPKRMPDSAYCWEEAIKKPRVDWINKQIKQLEKV